MKKFLVTAVFVFLSGISVFAQSRWGFVDIEVVMQAIPEYVSAQKQLDALSMQWQKETDMRLQEIEKLTKAYQADQVLFTDEMRKHRESEIGGKEKQLKDFQNAKFGVRGELFQQHAMLIKPIQEKVARAIQAVAVKQNLDKIEDKQGILFADPRFDRTNDVIIQMGYKPVVVADK